MNAYEPEEAGVAEALFDNEREWPDELGFRRGERLRVLDTRPAGGLAAGWWLCADSRGNRGIAPANRLALIQPPPNRVITPRRVGDVFAYGEEGRPSLFPASAARLRFFHDAGHPFRLSGGRDTDSDSSSGQREPVVRSVPIRLERATHKGSPPPPPQRRYFHDFSITRTVPPPPDASAYKAPYQSNSKLPGTGNEGDSSQSFTPPDGSSLLSDSSGSAYQDPYDVPSRVREEISNGLRQQNSEDATDDGTLKRNGTNGPSIPPPLSPAQPLSSLPAEMERVSVASDRETEALVEGARELRVTVQEAMETLFARQQDLQSAVAALLAFPANRHWRKRRVLYHSLSHINKAVSDVCAGLNAFVDFATGCLVNLSSKPEGRILSRRLTHMLRPLRDSQRLLDTRRGELGRGGWALGSLARENAGGNDALDQFVAVAKSLPDDSRQITAFLQGNASLIFPAILGGSKPAPPPVSLSERKTDTSAAADGPRVVEEHELDSTADSSDRESLFDDYDFVHGPEANDKGNGKASREEAATPTGSGPAFSPAATNGTAPPSGEDKDVLSFYSAQVEQHMQQLSEAIEDFLSSIEENKPPSVYVGKSKLVILGAHKLVYIGDSLAQLLRDPASGKAKAASDELCRVLKHCVAATKAAAAAHPSVPAVQAMVDAMVAVSHAAHALRLLLRSLQS